MWGDISVAFLLAFISAYVITPYTIRFARKIGALDIPKETRKIHKKPMPRLGGLAVIIGFTISVIYLLTVMSIEKTINLFGEDAYYFKLIGYFLGMSILSAFCFIDDLKGIHPLVKLSGQLIAAIVVTLCGIQIDTITVPFLNTFVAEDMVAKVITVIWIVGITNAINLIDGLDRFIKWCFSYFLFIFSNNICT